jgi:hypothetical protein
MRVDQLSTRSRLANITSGLDSCADSPEPLTALRAERCFAQPAMPASYQPKDQRQIGKIANAKAALSAERACLA